MEQTEQTLIQEDELIRLKARAWDNLFSYRTRFNKSNEAKESQSVPVIFANKCKDAFDELFKNGDEASLKKARTNEIDFDVIKVKSWIDDTIRITEFNNLKLVFGAYTTEIYDEFNGKDGIKIDVDRAKLPRITIFMWPYKDDKPAITKDFLGAEPFNLGHIHP